MSTQRSGRGPAPKWEGVAAVVMLFLITVQLAGRQAPLSPLWTSLFRVGDAVGVRQNWSMFAPECRADRIWLVADTELSDGRHVDFFTSRAPDYTRPPQCIGAAYPSRLSLGMVDIYYSGRAQRDNFRLALERMTREKFGADRWRGLRVYVMYQSLNSASGPFATRL